MQLIGIYTVIAVILAALAIWYIHTSNKSSDDRWQDTFFVMTLCVLMALAWPLIVVILLVWGAGVLFGRFLDRVIPY